MGDVRELTALLGLNRKTVYSLIAGGEIPDGRRLGAADRCASGYHDTGGWVTAKVPCRALGEDDERETGIETGTRSPGKRRSFWIVDLCVRLADGSETRVRRVPRIQSRPTGVPGVPSGEPHSALRTPARGILPQARDTAAMRLLLIALVASVGLFGDPAAGWGEGAAAGGAAVPDLKAPDHRGAEVALRDGPAFVGVLPSQGQHARLHAARRARSGTSRPARVRVIGVSTDSAEARRKFAEEHGLPFSLIADEERQPAKGIGVGTFLWMSERVSFLIGSDGGSKGVPEDRARAAHDRGAGRRASHGLTSSR